MKAPVRLLIHGASGRMGRALLRLAGSLPALRVVAAVSRSGRGIEEPGVLALSSTDLNAAPDYDVAIDFSLPEGFDALLSLCRARKSALVCGTTGLSSSQRAALDEAGGEIPVLWAANFSLGVVVLEELLRRACLALPAWDAGIVECHHSHKKDAPSGTALSLSRVIERIRGTAPPVASLRAGDIVGDHTVHLVGPGERIELTHRAGDRDIFARGALAAAMALAGRPASGYRLADLILGGNPSPG